MRKILFHILFLCFFSHLMVYGQTEQQRLIKVGIYINPPKVYLQDNRPAGIYVSILENFAAENNYRIEYVHGEWKDLLHKLQKGEIDIMPDMAYSEQRDCVYTFNKISVLNSWMEVFTLRQNAISGIKSLHGKNVGVLEGSLQEDFFKDSMHNLSNAVINVISYKNYRELENAMLNHEIEAMIAHRFFYFADDFHRDIFPTGIILKPTNLYFAFNKSQDSDLVYAVDKTLSYLKNQPNSVYYQSLDKLLTKKAELKIPRYVFVLLGLALFITIVAGIFAVALNMMVNRKTAEIQEQKQELFLAKEKAEESEKLKNAFLQNVSHEIRTPMNAIIGFSGFLNNQNLSPDKRMKYVQYIQESSQQLLGVLENIITMASLTQKLESADLEPVRIAHEMEAIYKLYYPKATQNNLDLQLEIDQALFDKTIWCDKRKITLVINSLLNNALKFTPKGKVILGCSLKDAYKGHGLTEQKELQFFVKDTGIGIKPENQKKVFESFYQADMDIQITYGGAGLGLSIAKEMISLLGGEIWLESEPEIGTSIYFTLPYAESNSLPT